MPSQLTSNSSSWKQEVNRRVAAHKNRKGPARVEPEHLDLTPRPSTSRAAEVLARVNARYAKAPSYNSALTEEGRAAVRAAEGAVRTVADMRPAANNVLPVQPVAELESQKPATQPVQLAAAVEVCAPEPAPLPSYEVRWSEELPEQRLEPAAWAESAVATPEIVPQNWQGTAEQEAVLETPPIEVVDGGHPIPGNLIEFPRELVAPRKARRHQDEDESAQPQLSIFEVDPASVTPLLDEPILAEPIAAEPISAVSFSAEPVREESSYAVYTEPVYAEPAYPETSYAQPAYAEPVYAEAAYAPAAEAAAYAPYPDALIPRWIDEEPVVAEESALEAEQEPVQRPVRKTVRKHHKTLRQPQLQTAPISTRLLAGVVNLSLMLTGLVVAGLTAARGGEALPSLYRMEFSAAIGLVLIGLLYTSLFYLLSDSTPGMRYAHLRLVNFDGRRANRSARFVRLGCLLLSILPLGLGFLSMLWDEENLCWHDKLSRTYLSRY
jgi:uncharacterized RDD family membrane protein YckC